MARLVNGCVIAPAKRLMGGSSGCPISQTIDTSIGSIDIRYLVKRDGHWICGICILEGYSRKLLAGMASEYQDLIAVLQLLAAALTNISSPMGIVSDNGAVFTAQTYHSSGDARHSRVLY